MNQRKVLLCEFNFKVNALYLKEILLSRDVETTLLYSSDNNTYQLFVFNEKYHLAKKCLEENEFDDELSLSNSYVGESYIADFTEHDSKVYDPGHYSGGKIPHFLLDKTKWKLIIPFYIFFGLVIVASIIYTIVTDSSINAEAYLFGAAYLFAGISMIWQLRSVRKK